MPGEAAASLFAVLLVANLVPVPIWLGFRWLYRAAQP
jgi:hypothetical protein